MSRLPEESVWDYPRPPAVETFIGEIRIIQNNKTIAQSQEVVRVLETSHPPNYYIPKADIEMHYLKKNPHKTICEFKGIATYWDVDMEGYKRSLVGWSYEQPNKDYEEITGYLSFYAGKLEACYVNEERIQPQPGDFYGGWITGNIKGPFKGGPGTVGW